MSCVLMAVKPMSSLMVLAYSTRDFGTGATFDTAAGVASPVLAVGDAGSGVSAGVLIGVDTSSVVAAGVVGVADMAAGGGAVATLAVDMAAVLVS